eukprot:TRINITY_DN103796_c0_g1_i1.p1 TRINITY_DN103796_c0_g1~~TRINITY_DN103796_c0_g1_i1.p1  ORF type:complete len:562 (+),score=163.79 TRINITY_DN103796_c0_g1_i1:69-1754(+)
MPSCHVSVSGHVPQRGMSQPLSCGQQAIAVLPSRGYRSPIFRGVIAVLLVLLDEACGIYSPSHRDYEEVVLSSESAFVNMTRMRQRMAEAQKRKLQQPGEGRQHAAVLGIDKDGSSKPMARHSKLKGLHQPQRSSSLAEISPAAPSGSIVAPPPGVAAEPPSAVTGVASSAVQEADSPAGLPAAVSGEVPEQQASSGGPLAYVPGEGVVHDPPGFAAAPCPPGMVPLAPAPATPVEPIVRAVPAPSCEAVLYDKDGFEGETLTLHVGEFSKKDLHERGLRHVKSLQLSECCSATIYANFDLTGPSVSLSAGSYAKDQLPTMFGSLRVANVEDCVGRPEVTDESQPEAVVTQMAEDIAEMDEMQDAAGDSVKAASSPEDAGREEAQQLDDGDASDELEEADEAEKKAKALEEIAKKETQGQEAAQHQADKTLKEAMAAAAEARTLRAEAAKAIEKEAAVEEKAAKDKMKAAKDQEKEIKKEEEAAKTGGGEEEQGPATARPQQQQCPECPQCPGCPSVCLRTRPVDSAMRQMGAYYRTTEPIWIVNWLMLLLPLFVTALYMR